MDNEEIKSESVEKHIWPLIWLFNTNIRITVYVIRTGLISLIPSLIISFTLTFIGILNEETLPEFKGPVIFNVIGMIFISPVVETFLLALILKLLSFITKHQIKLAVISAVLWAGFHSLLAPAWGLGVVWPFFVFSCCYQAWRQRSFWYAILVTSCVHAFQNFIPTIVYVISQ